MPNAKCQVSSISIGTLYAYLFKDKECKGKVYTSENGCRSLCEQHANAYNTYALTSRAGDPALICFKTPKFLNHNQGKNLNLITTPQKKVETPFTPPITPRTKYTSENWPNPALIIRYRVQFPERL